MLGEAEDVMPQLIQDMLRGTVRPTSAAPGGPDIMRVPAPRWDLVECRYGLGYPFRKGVKRSIGTGRKVVVLCSLEISRMVWRKRSWSAMGSLLMMAAA